MFSSYASGKTVRQTDTLITILCTPLGDEVKSTERVDGRSDRWDCSDSVSQPAISPTDVTSLLRSN